MGYREGEMAKERNRDIERKIGTQRRRKKW